MTDTTSDERVETKPDWGKAQSQLVYWMNNRLSGGDRADLRRMRPDEAGSTAFWRLLAGAVEPTGVLPADGPARDAAERRWAACARALALLPEGHRPGLGLGEALAKAGFAELRFVRLLRASEETLWDEARKTAAFLASKAAPFDHRTLVALVTSDGTEAAETTRRRIARDYYRHAD